MALSIDFTPENYRKFAHLTSEQLENVLSKVSAILDKEHKLIEINTPQRVYFLGDTHGNFSLSIHALKHLFPPANSSHKRCDKVVFLGDFIDRGIWSIENINLLMSLKAIFPERVILIRGNHETREINCRFEFYEAVVRRYGMDIFERYNAIFAKMPLAVLTWNKIFAVHGGVPEGLDKLNDINGVEEEIDPEDRVVFQILWNDPVEKDGWFFHNFRGKYSKKFGRQAFEHFIAQHDIKLFLRAHEIQREGYKEFFNAQLISLDSGSTKWRKNTMKVFILEPSGEYQIAEVEDFEDLKLSKIFE